MKDYYRILRVSPGSSLDEIIKAYHKLAKKYDPDIVDIQFLNENEIQWLEKKFEEIVRAKSILSDPGKRKKYDDNLKHRVHHRSKSQDSSSDRSTGHGEPERHRTHRSSSGRSPDRSARESSKKSGGRENSRGYHSAGNRKKTAACEDRPDYSMDKVRIKGRLLIFKTLIRSRLFIISSLSILLIMLFLVFTYPPITGEEREKYFSRMTRLQKIIDKGSGKKEERNRRRAWMAKMKKKRELRR